MHNIDLSYLALIKKAWPIILANAASPLLGLVDTAVLGHSGSISDLAALAVVTMIFNFLYWGFGFLRMGTTSFIAKAHGAQDHCELLRVIVRSVLLALCAASLILLFSSPIFYWAVELIEPPASTVQLVSQYFSVRIWAAPATLLSYVIAGVFIGRGDSRYILYISLLLNCMNALLDIVFVFAFDMGVKGIALGTAMSEYTAALFGLLLLFNSSSLKGFVLSWREILDRQKLKDQIFVNVDVLLRTFFLLFSFSFFIHISASFGETVLAANHLILQLISFSAFFLDGFAHVLEALAGQAVGRKSRAMFDLSFKRTSWLAAYIAVFLAGVVLLAGDGIFSTIVVDASVVTSASNLKLYGAIYIALAFAAFQLDGLFIGVGFGEALRNASIMSCAAFVLSWYLGLYKFGVEGLWLAFIGYVGARALCLGLYLPSLKRRYFSIDSI